MENKDKFEYSYSAPTAEERRQIESIRKDYAQKSSPTKMERLKALDKKVKTAPRVFAAVIAVAGALILGLGMSMIMEWNIVVWGAVVGCIGLLIAACAYPAYKAAQKRYKAKYGEEIVKLSDELLGNTE